jgi:hypothetical protein
MLGYVLGGLMIETGRDWRLAIVVQLFLLIPLTLMHLVFPNASYEVSTQRKHSNSETESDHSNSDDDDVADAMTDNAGVARPTTNMSADMTMSDTSVASADIVLEVAADYSSMSVWESLQILCTCEIYIFMSFGLASLYFVVTGIQFWVTRYLTEVLLVPRTTVLVGFTVTSVTAPVLGVIMSGWVLDKLGGYKGASGMATACKCCAGFAALACAFAIPAALVSDFSVVICCLWMVLLWGGGVVPIASGLVLSSVPEGLQAFSFSLSICTYQIIGYGAGTFLPGLFIQLLEADDVSEVEALRWGWRILLLWGAWGVVFLSLALRSATRNASAEEKLNAAMPLHDIVADGFSPTVDVANNCTEVVALER